MTAFEKNIKNALFEITVDAIHTLMNGNVDLNTWHNYSDRACSERLILKKVQFEETYITEVNGQNVLKISFKLSPSLLSKNPNMFDMNIIMWSLVFPLIKEEKMENEVTTINDYFSLANIEINDISEAAEENVTDVVSILLS